MKTRLNILACFVLALGSGSATAEPKHPDPVPGPICEVQQDQVAKCTLELGNTKIALGTCIEENNKTIEWARNQCPAIKNLTNDQVREHVKTNTDVKKPPPAKGNGNKGNGNKNPGKDPKPKPEPKPEPKPRVTILVVVGKHVPFAPNAECKNGGYYLPIGFDVNGNKKLDPEEVKDKLPACKGDKGDKGDPGKAGAPILLKSERFLLDPTCSAGGTRAIQWTDFNNNGVQDKGEPVNISVTCDGRPGSAGRPGSNGDTRVQFGLGLRTSGIWSRNRPPGLSVAPEGQLELWLAPTAEFVLGVAWAPDGDRNMVVTGQLRYRALNKRLGFGLGVQYQAWNLEGNKALWQSVMGLGSVQVVLLDSKRVDVSLDAGLLIGLDGYDTAAQFAIGATGGLNASLKF